MTSTKSKDQIVRLNLTKFIAALESEILAAREAQLEVGTTAEHAREKAREVTLGSVVVAIAKASEVES